jgi:signal transduction histidine kinase
VACNASALVVLKRGEGNVIGQSLLQTFPNVLRYGVFEKYRKVFEGGAAEQFEAQYNRGDRVFWFRVNVFAYSKGLGVLFTDITDLIETREALKQTNRALERFSGTISHDLKAPVRRIVQYVDVLREEGAIVEPEHAEFFKVIQDNARHVSSLIDNLLAYTKARGPVHQARSFNIRLSVDRALHVLAGEIKDSGVRIIIPNEMPEVMGNEILLSQVFQNLISNAIRYNGTQNPEIRITSSRGKRYGEFSVIDNGPGIPAHETKAAFDFMVSLTEGKGGHGIGLAITKEIIERHFGSIWIDPFYKDGACFSFLLPLAPQA